LEPKATIFAVLVNLSRPPIVPSDRPPLLVLLHGFGSNEADLFALAPELDGRFQIVSLRAPIPLGGPSFAWFRLDWTPKGLVADAVGARQARDLLVAELDDLVARFAVDQARVYLAGFSQGAIVAAAVTLTAPEKVAGAALMSGRVMPEMLPGDAERAKLAGKPIVVTHGTYDDVLPIADGRASRDLLAQLPVDLTYREYAMGHGVSPESLRDVSTWLGERLDAAGP